MIVYNNNSTSKVFYSGFTITKIYACGGELVWSESPFTFKAQYTLNDATSGEVVCNGSSTLTPYEFDDTHNIRNMIVGECVDTWQVPVANPYTSLRTLDLSHSNITTLPEKFMNGVTTLREVSLNPSATTISKDAFNGCTSLSAITIPSSVTNIGMNAFKSSGLKNATIYSGITYSNYVYDSCNALTAVTIEPGTRMIEQGTFAQCTGLTSVDFPSSIVYLGEQAFISCRGMEYMVFHSTTPPNLGTDALRSTNNCIFYVPCSAMAAYLGHEDWQQFADRLRPIESDCSYIQYRWTPSGTTCLGVDKYENSIKQVTYNSGTTWQNVSPAEYSATTLIEANSYDCGYRTRTTSSATYCDGDDLYVDVYSQVSEDGGSTWQTTATTKTLVEAGGCAIEPQYRTLTTATTCVNVDKYTLAEYQVSYDEGETWTTTGTSATTLIESNSYDCGYRSRTVSTGVTCVGVDKHYLDEFQVSEDSGTSWTTVSSTTGSLIEAYSYDCGYRTRETSGSAYCNGTTKYIDVYSEYSEDGGQTWQTASTTPTLIEEHSFDCGYRTRTVSTGTTCVGNDKHSLDEFQVSEDSGTTWTTVSSTTGSLIESNSYDCGYRTRTLNTATTCVNVDKYTLEEYQVSTDSGSTWTTTGTSATTLIEQNSYDCGYRTRTTSSATYCDNTNKMVDVYDQVSEDSGTTWTTTATTTTLLEEHSYDCGYRTRETSGSAYCNGVDKYIDVYSEYSEDSGSTWQTASTTPTLVETNSYDCGYRTRTLNTATTCVNVDKYTLEEYQVSTDSGSTWTTTGTSATTLIEANSYDCGYRTRTTSSATYCDGDDLYVDVYDQVSEDSGSTWTTTATTKTLVEAGACASPTPSSLKFKITHADSSVSSGECDATSAITYAEVNSSFDSQSQYRLTARAIEIGECVTEVASAACTSMQNVTGLTIGSNVTTIGNGAFQRIYSASTLTIPNGVITIGDYAFENWISLSSVTIPDSVQTIGEGAFTQNGLGVSTLSHIEVGSGVTSIANAAFAMAENITVDVYMHPLTPPTIDRSNNPFTTWQSGTYNIYIPSAAWNAYLADSEWSFIKKYTNVNFYQY